MRTVLLIVVCVLAIGCKPRALAPDGSVVDLDQGMSGAQVRERMGREPDEVRALGKHREDWLYLEPDVHRTFILRMRDGELQWVKTVEQPGMRFDPAP